MSVLVSFSIFPTDVGESKSKYVSLVLNMIRDSGMPYKLTPMGTIVETDTMSEALQILEKSYTMLEPLSNRVYLIANFDIRKNKNNRIEEKIKSVEDKIGKVST